MEKAFRKMNFSTENKAAQYVTYVFSKIRETIIFFMTLEGQRMYVCM